MGNEDIQIKISLNGVEKAQANLKEVEASIHSFGSSAGSKISSFAKKAASDFDDMAKKFTLATSAMTVAAAGFGAKRFIDFEYEISSIKALTGATNEQVDAAKKLAMEMGIKTKFSALEAAQGIEELLKAGVSLETIMHGGLKDALDLAAAGEISVKQSAELTSTAINAFKADSMTTTQAVNILSGAANASATDIQELSFGLQMSSAVAAGMGLTFKDTATALAVFAQNGLKGSDAGTSLKTMLLNLIPSSKKQKELFDQLGVTTNGMSNQFFDAQGKIKDLSSIGGILQDKLKGMTDQQRLSTLEMMFGTDAIRAANILYKEGSKGILEMWDAMSHVTAASVAAEKMKNLKGAIDNFLSTLETQAIVTFDKFGQKMAQVINKITEWLNNIDMDKIANKVQDALNRAQSYLDKFGKWFMDNKDAVILAIGAIAAAFVSWTIISTVLNPAVLILTALGAAVFYVKDAWDKNAGGIQTHVHNIKEALTTLWEKSEPVRNFLVEMGRQIKAAWDEAVPEMTRAWNELKQTLQDTGIWEYMKGAGKDLAIIIGVTLLVAVYAITKGLVIFIETAGNFISAILGVGQVVKGFSEIILGFATHDVNRMKNGFSEMMRGSDSFRKNVGELGTDVMNQFGKMGSDIEHFKNIFSGNMEQSKMSASKNMKESAEAASNYVGQMRNTMNTTITGPRLSQTVAPEPNLYNVTKYSGMVFPGPMIQPRMLEPSMPAGAPATRQYYGAHGNIMGYAGGGMIAGNSYSGDRVLARVNSGEMVLNQSQQLGLLNLIRSIAQGQKGINIGSVTFEGNRGGGQQMNNFVNTLKNIV